MNLNSALNIIVAGVGGQGVITLARVLAEAANIRNVKALVAETHGLSQRGGSVIVHLRLGNISSPLIPLGGSDVIVSLELTEAVRSLSYAKKDTRIITDTRIIPVPLPGVKMPKPNELMQLLAETGLRVSYLESEKIAVNATGNPLTANIVMVGFLLATGLLNGFVDYHSVRDVVSSMRYADINLKALEAGFRHGISMKRDLNA